jgi:hypothetical protein
MSFQRVIETARRTGVPVIMTDVAGREPMVILSLEQFEAMAGDVNARESAAAPRREVKKEKVTIDEDVERALAELAAEKANARLNEVAADVQQGNAEEGLSIEERFYLEPVEDKS